LSKKPAPLIEEWLIMIAEKLRRAQCTATLLYEDRYQGNELALTIQLPNSPGFACLYAHRSASRKASLIFVADSLATTKQINSVLLDLHKTVSRFENAKRKFLHRIERMLSFLQDSFEIRAKESPVAALEKLRGLFPSAQMMTGAEARFREKAHETGAVELEELDDKEEKKFPTFYGVKITSKEKTYSALYYNNTKKFHAKGALIIEALALLEQKREKEDKYALLLGIAPQIEPFSESSFRSSSDASSSNSSTWHCDVAPDCGNVGGCDLPDCDLPDCSVPDIDCGGCDLSF
jgi:hypothetical protein